MQLIQELTLIQKVGAFIGIPLILLLVMVAARRRRAAAPAGDPGAAVARSEGRRRAKKAEPSIPRRKRRWLAAEAAHAMGTPVTPPEPVAAEATAPVVEPVTAVAAEVVPEAVEAPVVESPPPVPVVPAPVEDPYVRDTTFAEEQVEAFARETTPEVVVAAPGWPSPGELASSFDPDAFDPLPAAAELADQTHDEPAAEAEEPEQPTGVIEMPAVVEDGLDERDIAQWDGDFDPATGWGDDEVPVPVAVAAEAEAEDWYDSERQSPPVGPPTAEPNPVDLEQFWGDADGEDPWVDSPEVEVITGMPPTDEDDESVPDWVEDDATAAWEVEQSPDMPDIGVPFHAPGSLATHEAAPEGWTTATPAQGSPVILDLAGLAASGHPVELVIESSGDGNVRVRFGPPNGTSLPVAQPEAAAELAVEEAEMEELIELPGPVTEPELPMVEDSDAEQVEDEPATAVDFDVPFLTGGLSEPDFVHVATAEPDLTVDTPIDAVPVEVPQPPIAEDEPAFDAIPAEAARVEPAPPLAAPELDPYDDPAQILADIRARLAALDGHR